MLPITLAVFGCLHAYLWFRLVHEPAWPQPWSLLATVALALLCMLIPVSVLVRLSTRGPVARALLVIGYGWMGTLLLFFVALVIAEPFRLFYDRPRTLAVIIIAAAGATSAWALLNSYIGPRVKRVHVHLDRLPAEMSGTRLVQISDVHIGPTVKRRRMQTLVDKINALEPDLVVLTGDLVDGTVRQLRDAAAPLADLRSRYGTFAVTGNHEYYWGADAWVAELRRMGVTVLRNQRAPVGANGVSFDLAGVDDPTANHRGGISDVGAACTGREHERELILLSHQPKTIDEAADHDVGLQLSGHTHGGQIWPWGWLGACRA